MKRLNQSFFLALCFCLSAIAQPAAPPSDNSPKPRATYIRGFSPLPIQTIGFKKVAAEDRDPKIIFRADVHPCSECKSIRDQKYKSAIKGNQFYSPEGLIYEPKEERKYKNGIGIEDGIAHRMLGCFRYGQLILGLKGKLPEADKDFAFEQLLTLFAVDDVWPIWESEVRAQVLADSELGPIEKTVIDIIDGLIVTVKEAETKKEEQSEKERKENNLVEQAITKHVADNRNTIDENLMGFPFIMRHFLLDYIKRAEAREMSKPKEERTDFTLAKKIALREVWQALSPKDYVMFEAEYDSGWREVLQFENILKAAEEAFAQGMDLEVDAGAAHIAPMAITSRISLNKAGKSNIDIEIDMSAFKHPHTMQMMENDPKFENTIRGYELLLKEIKPILPQLPNHAIQMQLPSF